MNKQWIAVHLYYSESLSIFLQNAVFPIIDELKKDRAFEHYFFIRYWEKGPHIRLRFLVASDGIFAMKKRLEVHFNDFYAKAPSKRTFEEKDWYPNNAIQWIPYEPEIERYYGSHGLTLSEKQFQHSSETVKEIIHTSESWDYDSALGAAIQLHLGFAHAMGFSVTETADFFNFCFEKWFPTAYYLNEKEVTQEKIYQRKEATLESFKQNFDDLKEVLITNITTIWNGLTTNDEFQINWLNQWVKGVKTIHNEIQDLAKKGHLAYPKSGSSTVEVNEHNALWPLYDSYIHMTNNRLGILNRDESFISYLLCKGLKAI